MPQLAHMKKFIPFLIIGVAVVLVFLSRGRTNNTSTASNPITNLFKKEIIISEDVCAEFSAEFVEKILGRKVLRIDRYDSNVIHGCSYYLTENSSLTINVAKLSFEKQKEGSEYLGRPTRQDALIKMKHFVSWQGEDLYGVYLKLTPDRYVAVSRSSTTVITNEENMKLAIAVADRIQKGENQGLVSAPTIEPTKKSGANIVHLPQEKNIVNNFFQLIDEGKASDAVMMMTSKITNDDSTKQAFGVQFSAMNSVKIKNIEESSKGDWTEIWHQYMITLDVVMDPSSADEPISYYGFERGENVRFVGLVKEDNQWKVEGLATGP